MPWRDITTSDKYRALEPKDRGLVKDEYFRSKLLPKIQERTQDNDLINAAYSEFMETPDDTGEGLARSMLGSAARGFLDPLAAVPEVAGAFTGIEGLEDFGSDIRSTIEGAFPVNPAQEGFLTDVAGVGGQVGQIVATGGAGALTGARLLGQGATEAAKRQAMRFGATAAQQTAMGSSAVAGGLERAEQLGLEGGDRLLRGAIAGGTELLAERLGGFATELGPVNKMLGESIESGFMKPIIRGIGTEAGEEGLAEAAGQATDIAMAPEAAPGMDLKNIGYAMLLGGVGGAAFGGIEAAITPRTKKAFEFTEDFTPSTTPPPGMTRQEADDQDLLVYDNIGNVIGYKTPQAPVTAETIEAELPVEIAPAVAPLVQNVAATPEASATGAALRRIAAEGAGAPAATQEIPDEIVTDEATALREAGLRMLTGQPAPIPAQAETVTPAPVAEEIITEQEDEPITQETLQQEQSRGQELQEPRQLPILPAEPTAQAPEAAVGAEAAVEVAAWKGVGKSPSGAASSGLGFFATDSKEYAKEYAADEDGLRQVSVSIRNPYQMDFQEFRSIDRGTSDKSAKEIADELKAAGHDGIVVTHSDGAKEYIAFSKDQIKEQQKATLPVDGGGAMLQGGDVRQEETQQVSLEQSNVVPTESLPAGQLTPRGVGKQGGQIVSQGGQTVSEVKVSSPETLTIDDYIRSRVDEGEYAEEYRDDPEGAKAARQQAKSDYGRMIESHLLSGGRISVEVADGIYNAFGEEEANLMLRGALANRQVGSGEYAPPFARDSTLTYRQYLAKLNADGMAFKNSKADYRAMMERSAKNQFPLSFKGVRDAGITLPQGYTLNEAGDLYVFNATPTPQTQPQPATPATQETKPQAAALATQPATQESTAAQPAEAVVELTELPSYFQRNPQQKKLWDVDESYAEPARISQSVGDKIGPRGTAFTVEQLMYQIAALREFVSNMNGRLLRGGDKGASTKELAEKWTTLRGFEALAAEYAAENPQEWQSYRNRQNELLGLESGADVIVPYPSPDTAPLGNIGKLDKKFSKNWRVIYPNGETALFHPTALRAVSSTAETVESDVIEEVTPLTQAQAAIVDKLPELEARDAQRRGLGFDYPRARIGRLPGDQNAYISRPDQKNVGVLSPDGSIKMLSPEESVSIQGEINAFEKRQAAQIDKRMATLREEAKKQSESKLYQLTPSDPVVRRLDGKWINNNTGKPLSRSKNDQRLLSQLENNPNIESYQVVAQSTDGGVSFIPASRAAQPAAGETGDAGVAISPTGETVESSETPSALSKLQSYISTLSPKAQAAWTPERLAAAQSYYATGNESALEPLTATQRKIVMREGVSESDAAAYEAEQKRQFALRNPPAATDSQFLEDYNAYVNSLSDETLQKERESREKAPGVDDARYSKQLESLDKKHAELEKRAKAGDKAAEAEAERMVADAARGAGGIEVFHSGNIEGNVIDVNKRVRGAVSERREGTFYGTTSENVARSYPGKLNKMFFFLGNPFQISTPKNRPASWSGKTAVRTPSGITERKSSLSIGEAVDRAKSNGYDGVVYGNIVDTGSIWGYTGSPVGDTVVAFSPNQIKSADPFTYSDDGKLIPLSERFQPDSPDIRYKKILRSADGSIRRTGVKSTPARAARNSYIGVIPGVENTWLGTTEDFDAEFPDGYPFDSKNTTPPADTEALVAEDGRAFIFIDRVAVLDGDAERAEQHGTSPGVEAIKRLLRHESFVHRGFMSLPGPLKARFADFVASGVIPEAELDYLVNNGYPQYKGWRDNKTTEMLAAEEWLAQRVERMGRIPQSGPIASIMDWLRDVWRWLTGGETTDLDKLRNTMRAMHKALGALDPKQRIVMELPDAEMLRRSYIGERAIENMPEERKQFMRDSLDTAKAMAAAGKSSEEIRAVTGWFPGIGKGNEKLRWEVPDNDASILQFPSMGKSLPLNKVVKHDALFELYPEIGNLPVYAEKLGGDVVAYWDKQANSFGLDPRSPQFSFGRGISTMLHEVQHSIQSIEGFARGGSIAAFEDSKELEQSRAMNKAANDAKTLLRLARSNPRGVDGVVAMLAAPPYKTKFSKAAIGLAKKETVESIESLISEIASRLAGLEKQSSSAKYRKLAGEIEARDIQARQNFTLAQRAATAPYSSENIAPEDAIVMFGGSGSQASMARRSVMRGVVNVELGDDAIAQINIDTASINYESKTNPNAFGRLETSEGPNGEIIVENHHLDEELRGKGIGGLALKKLQELTGKTIISDEYPSGSARSMWERLGAKRENVQLSEDDIQKRYVLRPSSDIRYSKVQRPPISAQVPALTTDIIGETSQENKLAMEAIRDGLEGLPLKYRKMADKGKVTDAFEKYAIDMVKPYTESREKMLELLDIMRDGKRISYVFDIDALKGQASLGYIFGEAALQAERMGDRVLADEFSYSFKGVGTAGGQALAVRRLFLESPRYQTLKAVTMIDSVARGDQQAVVNAKVGKPTAAKVGAEFEGATEAARDTVADAIPSELQISEKVLELGAAVQGNPKLSERIKKVISDVLKRGILLRAMEKLKSGSRKSIIPDSNIYDGLTLEEMEAELARLDKGIAESIDFIENEVAKDAGKEKTPSDSAQRIINRIITKAKRKERKAGTPDPVEELYKADLKSPMNEADFIKKAVELGVEEDVAIELKNAIDLQLTAKALQDALSTIGGDIERNIKKANEEANKFQKQADAIIEKVVNRMADPPLVKERKAKAVDPLQKAYRDQLKKPVSREEFIENLEKINVFDQTASLLFDAAEMERTSREAIAAARKQPPIPVETAKAIINRVQKQAAGETTRAKPKLDRVRILYKAHLRERMAEADFMDEAKAAGLTPQVAQELYDAAELEIAAILLSKEVRGKSENYDKLTRERLKHLDVDSSALVEYINRLRREGKLGPVNWRDIMQLPPTRQQVIKGTLLELVKQNPQLQNLSAEEQQTLADALEKVWERERERQFKLQVKRLEMPGAKQEDQEKVVSATPRIIKLINQGMLAEDAFYKAVGEQFGIKEMSDADRKRIMELSEIIQDNAIPEADKAKEVRELVTLLQKYHKLTTAEILSNVWVAHVLSGVRTQFDMAMGFQNGFLNTVKKAGLVIYKNPNAKGAKTAAKGIQQFFVGLVDGMAEAARYIRTEEPGLVRSDIEFINSYFEGGLKKGGLSTARKLRESDNKFLSALGSWLAILERVNTGWDVITYRATYQGTLAMAHALNPKIYKEALMPTTADFRAMEERAKTMLGANATRAQIKSRAFKYIEDGVHLLGKNLDESFMQEWKQMATEFNYDAKEAAMMVDPTGIGGLFYRGIMGLTEKAETKAKARADKAKEELLDPTLGRDQRFIRQVFPPLMYLLASQARNIFGFRFVRFTGNKINELISYIPIVGMARIYLEEGMYRNNELTLKAMSVQMNQLIATAIMIPAFIRAMYDLEDDDEERGYIIQGPWDNLTPERKSQLMADGFKPNTIAFYDKKTGRWTSYNYINWPSAGWFATAGSVSDYRRYTPEKWDEKTAAAKFMSGIYAGGSSFLDISSISQMTELFGRSTYSTDPATKGLEKVTKLATGYAGGFVPRIAKDVDSWFDKTVYKPEDTWGHIAKEMPFYRRGVGKQLRDIFYEPVEISRTPWSRALQVSPDDPAYKALGKLNSRGIWLTPANPENRKVKRGGKLRDMTDEEANAYMAEVGKRYKEFVMKQGDRLLEMDVDRADELVSKYTARIREIAFKKAIASSAKSAIR